ncbi:MAG: hypothetical protein KIT68_03660 [Phycisphaeraceae bacterium]|nr:hypothetical protein [Phycisphaeraceae bacterium]
MTRTGPVRGVGRGFTLIETMLAALLGGVVIVSTMGLFTAMQRAERSALRRAVTTGDLTLLHGTCARAMRTLVLNARGPGAPGSAPTGAVPGATARPGIAADENTPDRRPRIILEPDGATGLQRLEVVVAEPPIFSLQSSASNAYGAVRGALEFRPEATGESFAVYWLSYQTGETADRPGAVRSEVKVASGISKAQWRFLVSGEGGRLDAKTSLTVSEYSNLPAYAELDIETADGRRATWMFELMWSTAGEPGVVLASAAAAERAVGPSNRPPRTSNPNGSSGSGGAGRGTQSKPEQNPDKPTERGSGNVDGIWNSGGQYGLAGERAAREVYLRQLDEYERGMRTAPPRKPNLN